MKLDLMIAKIDDMIASMFSLENRSIDVMTAGKFLNELESIVKESELPEMLPLRQVAEKLSKLLEKLILDSDTVSDQSESFSRFEKGMVLMQDIVGHLQRNGSYNKDMNGFTNDSEGDIFTEVKCPDEQAACVAEEKTEAPQSASVPDESVSQDESLLKDFIIEALEYINEIEVNILNLEQNPDDKEVVNAIFRPFHSIKGVAGFLNLEKIRDLSHSLENALDKVRNDEWSVSTGLIDIILDGADALKLMIGEIKTRMEGRFAEPITIDLNEFEARLAKIEKESETPAQKPEAKKLGEILVDEGILRKEELVEALKGASQGFPPKKIGEALIEDGKVTPKQISQALRKQSTQISDAGSIRVDTRKLDDLVNMVGELVITQSMIRQSPIVQGNKERKFFRDISQLGTITSELQRLSMSLRMIPIKQTFQRMSRLVRDLSKAAGKTVNIELVGEDTEIDRNMVEEIYNPLVHLIRNAVDHGIEIPQERVKLGKPEAGLIQLKAYHKGGHIVIEIGDNGRGLSKEKILDKAVKNGIIDSQENLSDQDIYKLIFLPGLSTAEKVTDVSGRGVGMDVVKQAIDKLRGKVEIETAPGNGTTFVTSFPLTMAIIDGMIVRVGEERYIIPTTAIRQLLRITPDAYSSVAKKGELINVRGQLMPLIRLYDLFGITPDHKDPWDAIVVVLDGEGRSKCLLVDDILGKEEVVIKGLGESLKLVKGVSGGAILGDGNVGLILDPEGIFELSEIVPLNTECSQVISACN
jgi:two-component system chemotaxis sensor kinase CheA